MGIENAISFFKEAYCIKFPGINIIPTTGIQIKAFPEIKKLMRL
jgi:hypothetical protein